jgi:hypothetical protein
MNDVGMFDFGEKQVLVISKNTIDSFDGDEFIAMGFVGRLC